MQLKGWVLNSAQGVFIEAEGENQSLESFVLRLEAERPPASFIQSLEFSFLDPIGFKGFEILPSDSSGTKSALLLPEIATCSECLAEVLEPANRRFRYPFMYVANEGRFGCFAPSEQAEQALSVLRSFSVSRHACLIGKVSDGAPALVTMKSRIGTSRIVDMLSGEHLPRIC